MHHAHSRKNITTRFDAVVMATKKDCLNYDYRISYVSLYSYIACATAMIQDLEWPTLEER